MDSLTNTRLSVSGMSPQSSRKRIWLPVSAVISILLIILFIDDPLEPEAQAWIDKYNNKYSLKDNGQVLLYGLSAPAEQDPYEYGLSVIKTYEENIARGIENISQGPKSLLPITDLIEASDNDPDNHSFCDLYHFSCYEKLWSVDNSLEAIIAQQSILLERYKQLHSFEEFEPVSAPNLNFPTLNSSPQMVGRQLLMAEVFDLAKSGDFQQALNYLKNEQNTIIQRMRSDSELMSFVIALVQFSENIKIASFITSKQYMNRGSTNFPTFELLTVKESPAYNGVFEREFAVIVKAIR